VRKWWAEKSRRAHHKLGDRESCVCMERKPDEAGTSAVERPTVTVTQAAVMLGILRASVHERVRRDEIPTVRLGRRGGGVRVPRRRADAAGRLSRRGRRIQRGGPPEPPLALTLVQTVKSLDSGGVLAPCQRCPPRRTAHRDCSIPTSPSSSMHSPNENEIYGNRGVFTQSS
jgi:hypothetical protein